MKPPWYIWIRQSVCLHEFDLDDLQITDIPPPKKPENNDYAGWADYLATYYDSDYVTKRVMWPCCKCGKLFYACCGLDIYAHGKPKKREVTNGND